VSQSGRTQVKPSGGETADDASDATRRTRLANERTYLAWWRTGLTAFAVALGTGKIVPELSSGPQWPYTVVGVGFAALGMAFTGYALRRHNEVDDALSRGEYLGPHDRFLTATTAFGLLLGVALLAVIVTNA
jgi:putative membrane protein